MAVIESVAMRQRGGLDFQLHYENLCALSNTCPLPAVKAHLTQNVLDLNGDRIRTNDWIPIMNTIKINRTLEYIAIRSFYQPEMEEKDLKSSVKKLKVPTIRSKELTHRLCRGLKDCLEVSTVLRCIELQGLPLRQRDTEALAKGIQKSSCLQHLSLENSGIGDDQVSILCRVIKSTMSIMSVNFSGCSLTWRSAEAFADVIKRQATERHSEAWKDSLRYRRPDLDRMAGLRRITANSNPLLGDKGAQALADVLRDDLWVKAVDLHHCGIGEEGAKALLNILKINTTLVVMDVRLNPLIGKETMTSIMDQVCINCAGHETEYKWIKVLSTSSKVKQPRQKKRTKALQAYGRKFVRASSTYLNRRSKSSATAVSRSALSESSDYIQPGTPWRTAMRAAYHKGGNSDHSASRMTAYESLSDVSGPQEFSGLLDNTNYSQMRDMKMELEILHRSTDVETNARINLEKKVQLLTSENEHLRRELKGVQERRSVLDDDRVLDSIEQSFKQFHSFLDLLRDIGLGQLIAMAGLDQTDMPFQHDLGVPLEGSRSRNDTTAQMKSFLEQSRLNGGDLSFLSDGYSAAQDSIYHHNSLFQNQSPDDSHHGIARNSRNVAEQQKVLVGSEKNKKFTSKFDELYQKALRNTESILQRKEFQPPLESLAKSNGHEAPNFRVKSRTSPVENYTSDFEENRSIGKADNISDDEQSAHKNVFRNKQNAMNEADAADLRDASLKLPLNSIDSDHSKSVSNALPELKILSDHSHKSTSSHDTKISITKLAETMSDLQDARQTGNAIETNEYNDSYDIVDENTISEESNLEEILDLNDSESQ